jgi:hypothetical protein
MHALHHNMRDRIRKFFPGMFHILLQQRLLEVYDGRANGTTTQSNIREN